MALKVYINEQQQAFLKKGNADIALGCQIMNENYLLQIFGAEDLGHANLISNVKIIKIDRNNVNRILTETTIDNSFVYHDAPTNQYLIDTTKEIILDLGFYYIQFSNNYMLYKSEIFFKN